MKTKSFFKMLFLSTDKFPPFRADTAVLLGKEMSQRGHRIDWVIQSDAPCDSEYETRYLDSIMYVGATDNGTRSLNRVRKHVLLIKHQIKKLKLVKNNQYDFIQVRNKIIVALAAIIYAKLTKTKFIYWLSFPFPEASLYKYEKGIARYPFFYLVRGHFFKFMIYRLILPAANHIFVQSDQMKKDLMKHGVSPEKMTPVPMGIDLDEFDQYRKLVGKVPEYFREEGEAIVYLGTLERTRQIDFLVRVHHIVLQQFPKATLYLVGDGQDDADRQAVKQAAVELNIDQAVVITGFLDRSAAMEYVKRADVCLSQFPPSPILDSTTPTKLIEYLAMEKPVVANDHPDQRKVISESGSGYCVPFSEREFAEAIINLLSDKKKAISMGISGRTYIEKVRSYSSIADDVEKQYLQLI